MKLALQTISLLAGLLFATASNAEKTDRQAPQRIIIIMMDGFGEQYYRNASMPFLNRMEREGIYKVVPSLMPAVTNVNNMSIATGTTPAKNGITGNVYFNHATGQEEYIEDPSLLLQPSILQQAAKNGLKTALLSVKQKTIDVLGKNSDYTLCPECIPAHKSKWDNAPKLSSVYTREVNYQLMQEAVDILKNKPEVGIVYIHTSDYPMHMWPPEQDSVKMFLSEIDRCIKKLHEAAPDAAILLTADHGMNHKTLAWDLDKVCAERKTPIKIAISPEKDKYVKHHKGLGGSAYVYLQKPGDSTAVRKTLEALNGVDNVLTRAEAASRFQLMPERIGDFMVLGDKTTVFGQLSTPSEAMSESYRSHGSTYEAEVPLFVYNAKNAPAAEYFKSNYLLAAWLFQAPLKQ